MFVLGFSSKRYIKFVDNIPGWSSTLTRSQGLLGGPSPTSLQAITLNSYSSPSVKFGT